MQPINANEEEWRARKRKYFSDYRKRRKSRLKERGVCVNCEKNPAALKRITCAQCLEDKKLAHKFGSALPYRQLYAELFERQFGLCGLCRKSMAHPVLDHTRATRMVRGLLCTDCHSGLRNFKDDPELLKRAGVYVSTTPDIGIAVIERKPNK